MNVLAIGAHYDDIELGCSGTLIKHTQKGDKVTMLVVTNSEYSSPAGVPIRSAASAHAEGRAAAKIIGAELVCLNYSTHLVPFDEDLTKKITQLVEDLKIETVYAPWTGDLHRDHQNTARCALMACRHIKKYLMYRSNFYNTESTFRGNFYSDISDLMDKKIEAISCHRSEVKRVNYKWLDVFKNEHSNAGYRTGVSYAECFEVIRYLA